VTVGVGAAARLTGLVIVFAFVLVALAEMATGATTSPPKTRQLPRVSKASPDNPPPSRPCPAGASDCLDVSTDLTLDEFIQWVARDVDRMWRDSFRRAKIRYASPALRRIHAGQTSFSKCEGGQRVRASDGPFYCAADGANGTVFIPMVGLQRLIFPNGDWKAEDFAISYAIAHEWGHHVQALAGTSAKSSRSLELGADCFAGVWGGYAWDRSLLSPGDKAEAVRLASLIGDAPGMAPNALGAHGTGPQRVAAFDKGYVSRSPGRCQ
jgi:uncharacterized protein